MGFDLFGGWLAPDGCLAETALDFVGVHGAGFLLECGGELGLVGFGGDAEEAVECHVGPFGGGEFGVEAEDLLVCGVELAYLHSHGIRVQRCDGGTRLWADGQSYLLYSKLPPG